MIINDLIRRGDARVAEWGSVLRASVPERYKTAASPVGAAQGYIAEMERVLDSLGYPVESEEYEEARAALITEKPHDR